MRVQLTLNQVLESRGMSQRELARLTGIRPPSINEMVHNQTLRLPLDNLDKICEVLECGISDVLKLIKELPE